MVVLNNKTLKEFTGTVISSHNKTVVVKISVVKVHPLYNKRYTMYKKCYAHDELSQCNEGDIVKIRQHRPISKLKRRKLVDVVEKALV